jgi:ribosomal protein S18 acetylase RimI-like enzyme
VIRPVARADLSALAALDRHVFGHDAYPAFFFRQALDLWPRLAFAVGPLGAPHGYALGAPDDDHHSVSLLSVAVDPSRRGSGDGAALVGAVLRAAAPRSVWLTVAPKNPARALYARLGFVYSSSEADYYGPGEDRERWSRPAG